MKARAVSAIKLLGITAVLSIAVYGLRHFRANANRDTLILKKEGQDWQLNRQFYDRHVIDPYQSRLNDQYLTLIAILDPDFLCPAYLQELEDWVLPANMDERSYGLLIFLPESAGTFFTDRVSGILMLDPQSMVRFSPDSPLAKLGRLGIFKSLYSHESGLIWSSGPSLLKEGLRKFKDILEKNVHQGIPEGTILH